MRTGLSRRTLLRAGAGCVALGAASSPRACEFFSVNLRIVHPWVRATGPGATVAALGMTFDDVSRPDRLIGVSTPVASGAELAGSSSGPALDLAIPEGRTTVLAETGLHIRLTGLAHPLEVGRTYPMRLLFEAGGAVAASISVDYARLF